ncbi:MAG: arginine repressor [Eubacteriales bacterium]|nr:arginine repressor [Eubacteriales bacterium]MDY3333058.1 arginine repressor [Gallibacter sp.]
MKNSRQQKLLEIITSNEINKQEDLIRLLNESGFKATQATISRDIKDLQLVKTLSNSGKYRYTMPIKSDADIEERYIKILRETILSVQSAENIVLIKTLSGCGNAAAEAIDSIGIDHTLGSIAGDNTILLIVESKEYSNEVTKKIKNI